MILWASDSVAGKTVWPFVADNYIKNTLEGRECGSVHGNSERC